MFRKTILATAAAGMLAIGGLAATTASAAPAAGVQFAGPGFNVQLGFGGGPKWGGGPQHHKACKPVTKNVRWWDKWGNARWSKVVVGYDCGRNHGPRRPFPGHGGSHMPKPPHHGGNWGW